MKYFKTVEDFNKNDNLPISGISGFGSQGSKGLSGSSGVSGSSGTLGVSGTSGFSIWMTEYANEKSKLYANLYKGPQGFKEAEPTNSAIVLPIMLEDFKIIENIEDFKIIENKKALPTMREIFSDNCNCHYLYE